MAVKARVSTLAKELGVGSKQVLAKLGEMGKFVKSASSTIEGPVERQLREACGPADTLAWSSDPGTLGASRTARRNRRSLSR